MGSCFSKNTTTTALTPTSQQFEVESNPPQPQNPKNEQQGFKKEIFVIKHRISHEIDRHPDEDDPNISNPNAAVGNGDSGKAGGARVRASSCSKEEVDAILLQCGRLSRSTSTGAQNPRRRRRCSGSKRSFDFDLHMNDDDDDDDGLNHHHRRGSRVSSPSSRRSSKERGSGSGGRRISISPSRRSESPFRNSNGGAVAVNSGGGNRPVKMVSVPATDKSSIAGGEPMVKRIHVKRNVGDPGPVSPRFRSPARTHFRVFREDESQERRREQGSDTRVVDGDRSYYKRKSLAEIDNNAARSVQPGNRGKEYEAKTVAVVPTSRLSRDLDVDPETIFDRSPSPPSYASLLLEDIHNFHQKNMNAAAGGADGAAAVQPAAPAFSLPACVSKACSIMEAVADLNATASLFSEDRWRNPTPIERHINKSKLVKYETVVNCDYVTMRGVSTEEQESSGSNSFASIQHSSQLSPSSKPNSADLTTRECEANPVGGFERELRDYPRTGIGRGRKGVYSTPEAT